MYDLIIEEMCKVNVAEKLDSHVCMNRDGEECQPSETFGCKLTHHIKYLDMYIVCDEVGENSSQKRDGHIGGTLHVCERNFTPQSETFNKDKRFTLMGLTTLSDKPLTYCVIFKVTKYCSEIEIGIDFTANSRGSSNNQQERIDNNLGHEKASFDPLTSKGNFFPGGSTCVFKDIAVLCFTRWNEYGGMTYNILKEIFETTDHFNLLPRIYNIVPFAMLDRHESRLWLTFLQYINDPIIERCVYFSVPYVGDSKEQNSSFNMTMIDTKLKLLYLKRKHWLNESMYKSD